MNMSNCKTKVTEQNAEVRNKNFDEVSLGYNTLEAVQEANRCLNCKTKPCVTGCPVNIDIPSFINEIKNENFENAYNIITKNNALPSICGRVCPQETQCEGKCVRLNKGESVAIGRLERFIGDMFANKEITCDVEQNNIKVAIIGSGPAGLSCAFKLATNGFDVTIFEALHTPGGVLVYGIPQFRLPKEIVETEINKLKKLNVKIVTDTVIGKTKTFDDLYELGFKYIFIASGAGLPKFMQIPGESLNGVYSANEYLTRINLMKAYKDNSTTPIIKSKHVVVVGGGNVAMDSARCAKRLGADVTIVYRRGMEELPARKEEIQHAIEEGINFKLLTNIKEIIGDNRVSKVKCVEMTLGEKDASGRRRPIENINSMFEINCDTVIMALGTSPNPLLKNSLENLQVTTWGGIIIDDNTQTSIENVFAGGDSVTGSATVILAMEAGIKGANAIINKSKQ